MTVHSIKLLGKQVFSRKVLQKKQILGIAFLLAVGLILYETYLSYHSIEDYSSEYAEITASYEVLKKTEEFVSLIKDIETGEQGFLLTQKEDFLTGYYKSREKAERHLMELEQIAAADLGQQSHLKQIRELVTDIHSTSDHLINLSRYQSPQAALESSRVNKGKILMDSLRKEIRRFEEKNRSLLWERKTATAQARTTARINSLFGNLFSLLLLGFTFAYLRKQLDKEEKQSRYLEQEVQKRTEELHTANEELLAGNEELNSYLDNIHATQHELEEQQKKLQAAYAALEQEDARKTTELEEARALQIALLPDDPPAFPHLDLKLHLSNASEVGGDYYDYEIDEKGDITFAIGDVTGHGLKAGILVATAKSYFQNLSSKPGPVIMQAISKGIKSLKLRGMYMGLAIIKQSKNTFTISAAGMPPMLVYRKKSHTVERIQLTGVFLGFHDKQEFEEAQIALEPDDILLAMSDGLIESFNEEKESLGISRLTDCLLNVAHLPSEEIVHQLIKCAEDWSLDHTIRDDLSIIAIKVK